MAQRVRVGSLYRVIDIGTYEWMSGLQPGDLVQVIRLQGGRKGGCLRHVRLLGTDKIGLCNIAFLESFRP